MESSFGIIKYLIFGVWFYDCIKLDCNFISYIDFDVDTKIIGTSKMLKMFKQYAGILSPFNCQDPFLKSPEADLEVRQRTA